MNPAEPKDETLHLAETAHEGRAEIRQHYFLDRYVIIAPKRNLRPDSFARVNTSHKLEKPDSPAIEQDPAIYEIKDESGQWQVKVIKNLYPALTLDNPRAKGAHEIVIETPQHNSEFSEQSIEQILRIFDVYRYRLSELKKVSGIRYVVVIKNDGPAAGASIAHAHSQIIALPLIPPTVEQEAVAADQYTDRYGTCPLCDVIAQEKRLKARVVFEDAHVFALSPYAVREPFGVWIMPHRHVGRFTNLNRAELHSIAVILKKITAKLDSANISFNFFLQESLTNRDHHFLIKVEPRPNIWAGLELSTGVIVNTVPPEYAALWYRDKVK